jgi:DUF2075 family protein
MDTRRTLKRINCLRQKMEPIDFKKEDESGA